MIEKTKSVHSEEGTCFRAKRRGKITACGRKFQTTRILPDGEATLLLKISISGALSRQRMGLVRGQYGEIKPLGGRFRFSFATAG
jgi:hypothetical protein